MRSCATRARWRRAPGILPMVKADAYGMGAVRVVRALEPLAPWGYGVATIEEGRELRRGRDSTAHRAFHLGRARRAGRRARARTHSRARVRRSPSRAGRALGGGAWHLADRHGDVALGRALGSRWARSAPLLRAHAPEGALTHFHSATLDDGSLAEQEARFARALEAMPARAADTPHGELGGPRAPRTVALAHRTAGSFSLRRGVRRARRWCSQSPWWRCARASSSCERCAPGRA